MGIQLKCESMGAQQPFFQGVLSDVAKVWMGKGPDDNNIPCRTLNIAASVTLPFDEKV